MKNIKDIISLNDLTLLQLRSMHAAELQWSKMMGELISGISDGELRNLLSGQAKSAAGHARSIEGVLVSLGATAITTECLVVRDIISEIRGLQHSAADPKVLHAGIIVACQSFIHYMIARYGSVASFAKQMEQTLVAATLHSIMDEEKASDEALSRLAEEKINKKAVTALIM